MILEHAKLLAPGFLFHWASTVLVFVVVWYYWAKHYPIGFRPLLAATIGTGVSLIMAIGTIATTIHTSRYNEYNAILQKKPGAPAGPSSPDTDPVAQMRSAFLKTLDSITQKPTEYSSDVKIKLLQTYAPIFPNGREDHAVYRDNLVLVYMCQRHFIQDLGTTLKKRKPFKSAEREKCEAAPGEFFYRAKLLPPEVVKHNGDTIDFVAKNARLPGPNGGKGSPITEKDIEGLLKDQDRVIAIVQNIFE